MTLHTISISQQVSCAQKKDPTSGPFFELIFSVRGRLVHGRDHGLALPV